MTLWVVVSAVCLASLMVQQWWYFIERRRSRARMERLFQHLEDNEARLLNETEQDWKQEVDARER